MERTISGMVGKGSVNHNTRAFTAKNVDSDRSGAKKLDNPMRQIKRGSVSTER